MNKFTSTSEQNLDYLNVTQQASFDDKIFESFKINKDYNEILEHVNENQGQEYLNLINNSLILNNIEKFKINDILGNPKKYNYSKTGLISPTTLRYVKVLQDLIESFNLENSKIIEIGCGYGGQYVVLKQIINPKRYSFVDLPHVLPLIKTYIDKLNISDDTEFIDGNGIEFDEEYDLVISNYGISECDSETQLKYLEKVIRFSKHGYITHNQFNGYPLHDFIEKLKMLGKNPTILPENPLTSPNNVIIRW